MLEAAGDYRIKATLGITGWLHLSVHSDGAVRHLDVGSRYPGGEENITSFPVENDRVIKQAQNGRGFFV